MVIHSIIIIESTADVEEDADDNDERAKDGEEELDKGLKEKKGKKVKVKGKMYGVWNMSYKYCGVMLPCVKPIFNYVPNKCSVLFIQYPGSIVVLSWSFQM